MRTYSPLALVFAVCDTFPDVLVAVSWYEGHPNVVIEAQLTHRYLVNSEGTSTLQPSMIVFAEVDAGTEAPDGMRLRHWIPFNAASFDQLPTGQEISKAIHQMAGDLTALRSAPVLDADYSGPVLFTGQASAEMFARVLAPNLSGQRLPLSDQQQAQTTRSELLDRMNRPVLPRFLSVFDDPTAQRVGNQVLLGHYQVDDQGVPARRVSLIEQGVLKNFLTTRQPIRAVPASNGHARLPGNYGTYAAAIGNLFVKSSETTPMADLKKRLIDLTKTRGKPYGMLVRKLDYPYSATSQELQSLAQASSQSGGSARPVSPPLLIYRVYPDGREELVRGLRFRGLTTRTLRDILAASSETEAFDFVNVAAPLAILGAGGYLAPASVISPGLLFDELELEPPQDQLPKPPTVPPPNGN